jgi:5-methylcytosine-specific restriction endonuclease McrA
MKSLAPIVGTADLRAAKAPLKAADPFYLTPEWKALRLACLKRDGFRCVVSGCDRPAVVADHIVARKGGGPDELGNLRSLCRVHDNRAREAPGGGRRPLEGRGV